MKTMKNEKLEVKKTRNGFGVFAKKDYKIGQTILEVVGPFITCDVDEDIDDKVRSNAYRYNADLYINPSGTLADFLNHSCKPNSKIVKINKKLLIESVVPISNGSEILFDYSTVIASDDEWEMGCNCGEKECRKIVCNFSSLPMKTKNLYIKNSIVPDYILKI